MTNDIAFIWEVEFKTFMNTIKTCFLIFFMFPRVIERKNWPEMDLKNFSPEVFLGKVVLKICNKFTGEYTF